MSEPITEPTISVLTPPSAPARGRALAAATASTPAGDASEPRVSGDTAWIVPFFAIITSGVVFFFSQVAQFGLLPH
jgi:hypothetical protein